MRAMRAAADREWREHAEDDWTVIDFRRWPRGLHRSAWIVAGYIGWNPFDILEKRTPAARAVNVLLTRQSLLFTIAMIPNVPDPGDPREPLLAWFNAVVHEHQHDIAADIEALGDIEWGLPASRRSAARKLVRMWEQGGAAAFGDLSAALP
jgi:hypothetical protein